MYVTTDFCENDLDDLILSGRGPVDNDGDGYTSDVDCNDNDNTVYPGAPEICDGKDNDCDNIDDNGFNTGIACDGTGECGAGVIECADLTTTRCSTNPGGTEDQSTTEICDNKDNDCDGSTDENLTRQTTCGVGECAGNTGTETCTAGNWGGDTCEPFAGATAEVCDNKDNDCDDSVDEDFNLGETCIVGIGACEASGVWICSPADPSRTICDATPGTPTAEVCDGIDNDCDGISDGNENLTQQCGTTDVGECSFGTESCDDSGNWVGCTAVYPTTEICDGGDNDCDSEVDEGLTTDADGDGLYAYGSCSPPPYDCDDTVADPSNSCNTAPGDDPVTFTDDTGNGSVTLPNVTGLGDTSITPIAGCQLDEPEGFSPNLLDSCYDIQTTATFDGFAEVCITIEVASVPDPPGILALRMLSCDVGGGNCEVLTTSSLSTDFGAVPPTVTLCALTDNFSLMALVVDETAVDSDFDGYPDSIDNCPQDFNPSQTNSDGDVLGDKCDNCPDVSNPLQEDTNGNGIGDACEAAPNLLGDINKDGVIDISDVILVLRIALQLDPVQSCSDINGDGNVDISDVILTLRMALGLDPLQECL